MKTRFFFVIYLHNEAIKSILDGMRIVADPSQKNFSHITVKGPYRSSQKKRLLHDNKLIEGKEIKVLGAGNFFSDKQNTVFLECEDKEELYSIWKTKENKDYKEFHPHITIYDGKNRDFAEDLFKTIDSYNINFSFIVDKLDIYSSAHKENLFNLKTQVDYSLLSRITSFNINQENVGELSNSERIEIINKLCNVLERINLLFKDPVINSNNLHKHHLLVEA
jgi:2'-5' RNA ligase